jgi:ABC-type antimicrobial peptide transport system permease subunit
MFLAAAFAVVALSLSFVGVFGLISYSVSTRRGEFAVRLALGARTGHILRLVMREGIVLLAIGGCAGLAGAAMLARLLKTQLFGVTSLDVPRYAIAIWVIITAGLLASWMPARRAAASNPMDIMRVD